MSDAQATERTITSLIPARIDRLPWSTFHTMVIVGLGTAWILDGIEVQIVAANGFAKPLHMSTTEVTAAATFYLLGQVLGALFFGKLTDRIGPVLGIVVILIRKHIPESPRWMLTHGYGEQAEEIVAGIEQDVRESGHELEPVSDDQAITLEPEVRRQGRRNFSQRWAEFKESGAELVEVFLRRYWKRTVLGVTLMVTQSFLYNAIFFTYEIVLSQFYSVSKSDVGLYMIPFAVGNLLGPILLGRFFDTVGRRKMIFATYGIAALVLAISAILFQRDALTPTTHTIF